MENPVFSVADLRARLASLAPAPTPAQQVQLALADALLQRAGGKTANAEQTILAKAAAVLDRYAAGLQSVPSTLTADADADAAPAHSSLASLLEVLERNARETGSDPAQASLDELMAKMEQAIARPAAPRPVANRATAPAKKTRSRKKAAAVVPTGPELKATRMARKAMAIANARRLVDDMNTCQPENPGPLNPQMLATRAITMMRDLSPAYLNRFLSLMDTLFWLEASSGREEAKKTKPP